MKPELPRQATVVGWMMGMLHWNYLFRSRQVVGTCARGRLLELLAALVIELKPTAFFSAFAFAFAFEVSSFICSAHITPAIFEP